MQDENREVKFKLNTTSLPLMGDDGRPMEARSHTWCFRAESTSSSIKFAANLRVVSKIYHVTDH